MPAIPLLLLLMLAAVVPAAAQPTPPPAPTQGEDCGCGVPSSPRGPR